VLAAEGSECERTCGAPDGDMVWNERVMVVRSPMQAHHQAAGLDKRLHHAETHLRALTPPRGRGKRPSTDAATLVEAMDLVRTAHRGEGLRSVAWENQVEQTTQDVGRGRGSCSREKRVIQKIRDHIPHIARQADTGTALSQRVGWQAFVTQAGAKRLSLQEAVLDYRHDYRVARICHRLNSRGHIAPLCVKRNEHIEGLTDLLTLGVRVCTVMEFVLRQSLETAQTSLPGLHPEHQHKMTHTPTAERLLQAFAGIALTIIQHAAGEDILRRLTPLSGLQKDILQWLGLGAALYGQLEIQTIGH
jgi:transposase